MEKKEEIDAERNHLNKELLQSGKYRHKVEKNRKAYRRHEKHKQNSPPPDD